MGNRKTRKVYKRKSRKCKTKVRHSKPIKSRKTKSRRMRGG